MTLITTQNELNSFCEGLKNAPYITVDTEFMREKTYFARLCLIQVSGPDKQAVAIDPLADIDPTPLDELLKAPHILKVFHAARQDLEIFLHQGGFLPAPLFDTQIAAMVCGYGDQIGYDNLVSNITGIRPDKSSQFTDWARRPLTDKQLQYALNDVIHLVDVYEHLKNKLAENGREQWVQSEMEALLNPKTYDLTPQNAWKRIKLRAPKAKDIALLQSISAWREREAQQRDVPRARILKDETIVDLVYQRPENAEALSRIRGFTPDMARGRMGRSVLEAIAEGMNKNLDDIKVPDSKTNFPNKHVMALEMLKMLLRIKAAEMDMVPRLLADTDDLEELILNPDNTQNPCLNGWRYEAFGKIAQEMLAGNITLKLEHGKVVVTTV